MMTSNTFSTDLRFSGILPTLPNLGKYSGSFDPAEIVTMIDQMKSDGLPTWTDSYNEGQSMNRLVQTARVADQLGYTEARDKMLSTVKARLEDWLTAESGEVAFLFYYNQDWKALIGYPAGHRQDVNLNDHHFHWGYFIHAAAAIEQYYPGWAAQWGEMVHMLIRDAANPSRTDNMFPFLRNFSPYAGHSWANGFASEPFGNDQESTSESMQFNSALIHWGTVIGNDEIRDLGIYLYTTEHSSVNEYWFDQNDRTFQPQYQYEMVARIWGAGYDNGTWWTSDVAASYGIQLYPIHGGSLYLGHNTAYVQKAWNGMTTNTDVLNNIPNDNLWNDTYWKFLSFLDADQALNLYNNYRNRNLKMGISAAQTHQWLHTMVALGQVAEEVTADYPIAAVFNKNGQKTYAAHNYGASPITVHFSDGYNLAVPARSRATSRDVVAAVSLQAANVELPTGGSTVLTANVSGSVTKVEFYKSGVLIGTDNSAPYSINTGSLTAGFPGFYAKAYVGTGFNLSNVVSVQVGSQLPYSGTPAAIPGIIEAAKYDVFEGGAGQGITYSDITTWNEGDFRTDEAVDAAVDVSEGATVGWIEAGEWLEYTINATQAGNYKVNLRYASGVTSGGGPFNFSINGAKVSADVSVITTGDWGAWLTKEITNVVLPAGKSVLRMSFLGGGLNIGKMTFVYDGTPTNNPPIAVAGANQEITLPVNSVTLNGSASSDPDGDALSYVWSSVSGPNTPTFSNTKSVSPVVSNMVEGIYILRLTVSDDSLSHASNVTITVNPAIQGLAIPGTIQAEDFSAMSGIETEGTGDIGGGMNVGWIDNGDWLDYNVTVSSAGNYTLNFRVAADGTAQKTVQLRKGATTLGTAQFTATSGWQNWTTASTTVSLTTGNQTLRVYASSTGFNLNWIEFKPVETCNPTALTAYYQVNGGSWLSALNPTIDEGDAINFGPQPATGGTWAWSGPNGFAATTREISLTAAQPSDAGTYVATFTNSCGTASGLVYNLTVNPDEVVCQKYEAETWTNMSGIQTENTTDIDGGINVGWIDTGDWMDYSVNIPTSGTYNVAYRVASTAASGQIQARVNGITLSTTNIPNTNGWQVWTTVYDQVVLSAGVQTLLLYASGAPFNVNWFELCFAGGETPNTAPVAQFSTNVTSGIAPVSVSFNAAASTDADGDVLSYSWNFGDGASATGISPQHIYTTVGNFTAVLTVSDGDLSTTFSRVISVESGQTNCTVNSANGDFSVEVSSASSNPSLTFIPAITGTGNSLCILYYGTSANGSYPASHIVPNVPFTINAAAGQTVYFYYTYNLATGGENNNSANKNSFVVGPCGSTLKQAEIIASASFEDNLVKVYPNPVTTKLTIELGNESYEKVSLYNVTGQLMHTENVNPLNNNLEISFDYFEKGVYMVVLTNQDSRKVIRVCK
jgi:PKD repeat protein